MRRTVAAIRPLRSRVARMRRQVRNYGMYYRLQVAYSHGFTESRAEQIRSFVPFRPTDSFPTKGGYRCKPVDTRTRSSGPLEGPLPLLLYSLARPSDILELEEARLGLAGQVLWA